MDTDNHKGQWCPHEPVLCQEGYCSECALHPDSELMVAAGKRNKEWARLEKKIEALIAEHHRLLGKTCFKPTTPELESMIIGGDDGSFCRGTNSDNSSGS